MPQSGNMTQAQFYRSMKSVTDGVQKERRPTCQWVARCQNVGFNHAIIYSAMLGFSLEKYYNADKKMTTCGVTGRQ